MGGLLYKDFVYACRIKKVNLIWILAVSTVLFISFRILFPGNAGGEALMGANGAGGKISLSDLVFVCIFATYILTGMSFINRFTVKIIEADEKNKIREYLSVMPFRKNTYVASKYIFTLIACYVFLSLAYVWGIVCLAYCEPGELFDLCQVLLAFITTFTCGLLFLAAIELPLFISFGKEKALYIKVTLLLALSFVVIGYVLFGNLNWISEHVDVFWLLDWVDKHQAGITIFQTLSPVITIGIYYLSYRITCRLIVGRD